MKKTAFTMIELIIIIVVAGILAAVMIPRLETDSARDAANKMIRDIQYTQHLAMVNDVYDGTALWQAKRWNILTTATPGYIIASTANVTGANPTGAATDAATKKLILGTTGNGGDMSEFGITLITVSASCAGAPMAFDNLGAPYRGAVKLATPCIITITGSAKTAIISVQPETGYAELVSVI